MSIHPASVRLVRVQPTQAFLRTPDGDEGPVYGCTVAWSDGTETVAEDLGTSREAVAELIELLMHSDLAKIHFEDVIDDFLA